jgi:transposase
MTPGDLTDGEWELLGPLLSMGRGRSGHESRRHLDGILWRAREGARWRAIPERYGKWNTVWRRFARWRDLGVFEAVFAALAASGAAEERVQMLDSSTIRAHQHAAGAEGGSRGRRWAARAGASRPSSTCAATPAACRSPSSSRPVGRTRPAPSRLWSRTSPPAPGDMGYDANWVREELLCRGVLPVIPANPVRNEPVALDRELYRLRNRVERLVNKLKQYRAVATRYDKTAESFLAFVQLAASRRWLRFVHTA